KKDEGECHLWAVEQSKYDPTNPPKQTAAAKAPTTASGTAPGAGARGAARGARTEQAPERGAVTAAAGGHHAAGSGGSGRVSEGTVGVSRGPRILGEVGSA